ncbi:MAG TPA: tetratricopeptide repeat protein, partial [Vicinamibacterales bacterium]|nr:tetratricopeptide repeat protein [Vicinamibacterales bacterium]
MRQPGRRRGPADGRTVRTVVAVLLTLAFIALPARRGAAQGPPARCERVLVLPFQDLHHVGRIYWLTEAAAVLLTDDFHQSGFPVVTREDRRRAFDRLQIPVDTALTDATAIRIARLVGASQVVLGTLSLDTRAGHGDELVAHARRIRIDAGRLDAPVVDRAPLRDLFTLFARLTRRLAPAATATEQQLAAGHPPLVAFEDYVKGLLAQNPATQARYLRSSITLDPGLDRARLALWSLYSEQGNDAEALEAVKAVAADSRFGAQARFRRALSLIRLKQYDDAWTVLSELSPGHPPAAVLNNLGAVALERGGPDGLRQAAYYFTRAVKADPDHADYCFNLGYTYWRQKDARAAVHWLREAVRRNPADGDAHFVLAAALRAS